MGPVKVLVRALRSRWVMWIGFLMSGALAFTWLFALRFSPTSQSVARFYGGYFFITYLDPALSPSEASRVLAQERTGAPIRWAGGDTLLPATMAYGTGAKQIWIPWTLPAFCLGAWGFYLLGHRRGNRSANPDACRRCGYPLGPGEAQRTCPECGARNPPARTRRSAAPDASAPDA